MSRNVPERTEFTFKSSGKTVEVQALGPSTMADIARFTRKQWQRSDDPNEQEPKPPVVDTPIGKEENRADPMYRKRYQEWEQRLQAHVSTRVFEYAAVNSVLTDVDYEALEALRTEYAEMGMLEELEPQGYQRAMSQPKYDKLLYVTRILCKSGADVRDFLHVVTTFGVVTEEKVQEHVDSFRSDV